MHLTKLLSFQNLLSGRVSSLSFSWIAEKPLSLRFYVICVPIHVKMSFPTINIRQGLTNLKSCGLNLFTLNFLPLSSTRTYHVFQVVEQITLTDQWTITDQGAMPYANHWELIELTFIVNFNWNGHRNKNMSTW